MSGHSKWSLDQAQEGRRRREARQALLEAGAGDDRRGEARAAPIPRPTSRWQNAIEKARVLLDAEGQHRARDRERRRRGRRRARRSSRSSTRATARRRRGDRRGADRQPQPHRGRCARSLHEARRQPRRRPARSPGCSSAAACHGRRRARRRGRVSLAAAEGGADDVELDGSTYRSRAPRSRSPPCARRSRQAGLRGRLGSELTMIPKTTVSLDDEGAARKTLRLIDALEESTTSRRSTPTSTSPSRCSRPSRPSVVRGGRARPRTGCRRTGSRCRPCRRA